MSSQDLRVLTSVVKKYQECNPLLNNCNSIIQTNQSQREITLQSNNLNLTGEDDKKLQVRSWSCFKISQATSKLREMQGTYAKTKS